MASSAPIDLPVAEPTRRMSVWWTVGVIGSLLTLLGIGVAMQAQTPNDPTPVFIAGGCALFVGVLPLIVLRVIRRYRVTVENGLLVVQTGAGTQRVALANLRAYGLHVIDLEEYPELETRKKRWAATMPGVNSGFYALRNGERAIVLLTNTRRVSHLRSDIDGLTVLLSLRNPDTLRTLIQD